MTLAADCFRCPGSRCPDFIRETCRRFVDLKAGVGPGTMQNDVSLELVELPGRPMYLDDIQHMWMPRDWSQGPCLHKWPLTS